MALKNINTNVFMDTTKDYWTTQIQFISPALVRAIKELSMIIVIVEQLAVKSVDRSGRASFIKYIMRIPAGPDLEKTFMNGSDVANAITHPMFKNIFDKYMRVLSAQESAVLEIDFSLTQALNVQAPGLIIKPTILPTLSLGFNLVSSFEGADIYNIITKSEVPVAGESRINWSQTPHIFKTDFGDMVFKNFNQFFRPEGSSDPLIGTWNYTTTEKLSGNTTDATTEFVTNMNTSTMPPQFSVTKNGTIVANLLDLEGLYVKSTSLRRETNLIRSKGDVFNFLNVGSAFRDGLNEGDYFGGYFERGTIPYMSFDTISSSLIITNNTTSSFPQGKILGQYMLLKNPISEIF